MRLHSGRPGEIEDLVEIEDFGECVVFVWFARV